MPLKTLLRSSWSWARGGHGLPKVSPWLAMHYFFTILSCYFLKIGNFWTVNRRRSRLVSVSSSFPRDSNSYKFFENRFTRSLVRREQRREQSCQYLKNIKISFYAWCGRKCSMRREMTHFFEILNSESDSPLNFASDMAPTVFPGIVFTYWNRSINSIEIPSKSRRNRCRFNWTPYSFTADKQRRNFILCENVKPMFGL